MTHCQWVGGGHFGANATVVPEVDLRNGMLASICSSVCFYGELLDESERLKVTSPGLLILGKDLVKGHY